MFTTSQQSTRVLPCRAVRKRTFEIAKHLKTSVLRKKQPAMSNNKISSLLTLPVELVYQILDKLDYLTILLSCQNVCKKLNDIIDTYHRYQVIFAFILKLYKLLLFEAPQALIMNMLFS